jgi:cytoskeletal protein CcmA (bactofilin family)
MALFGKTKSSPKAPVPPPAVRSDNETAYVGNKLAIKGKISGSGNLIIMGTLDGDCDLKGELHMAPPAVVNAEIKATAITVSGSVTGNLAAADKIYLEKSAQVRGRLVCQRISIADGALFNGEIEMARERRDPQVHGPKIKAQEKTPAEDKKNRSA